MSAPVFPVTIAMTDEQLRAFLVYLMVCQENLLYKWASFGPFQDKDLVLQAIDALESEHGGDRISLSEDEEESSQ